jgi:hypothetical protein
MIDSENSNSFLGSQILDIDDKFDDDEEQINQPIKSQNNTNNKKETSIKIYQKEKIKNDSKAIPFIIFQDGKFIIQEQAKNIINKKFKLI